MRVYTHPKYSYVRVAAIPKDEIEKLDFALCKQPTETLGAFYKRQTKKPDILVNGGFFTMSNGVTCFTFRDENTAITHDNSYLSGIGIVGKNEIGFGNLNEKPWRDFISGYPNLIENGKKLSITFAKELNYKARRTMLGYNNNTVFIVCVENPGLAYAAMQDLMLDLGCTYAINLDGGGSTKMLHNGKSVTKNVTNRAVDNVVAIYLKQEIETSNNTTSKYLIPDKKIPITIQNKTITISQKIIPDNTKATKDIASYVKKGSLIKPQAKVNNGTGKPRGITIHNTSSISVNADTTMAEQYTRATYNGNMNGAMVHYYVSGYNDIWQLLNTEVGMVERGWHASDGNNRKSAHTGANYSVIGGNLDTIAIECIGNSAEAEDATALLVSYLCTKHNLNPITDIYTHNFFMNLPDKIVNGIHKNCPIYILPHWNEFLDKVALYSGKIINKPTSINNIDVTYQVYAARKWLGNITNYNTINDNGYAGIEQNPIQGLKIFLSDGSVQYRVHTINGKWLPGVVDDSDYAGILGKNIDGIQVKLIGDVTKTHEIKYRVSTVGSTTYLPWVNGTEDYAGMMGHPIDKVQIYVEKK
jgi:hypothetical protein